MRRNNDCALHELVVFYYLLSLQTETSIRQIVENAYKVTLACAFVPLMAGLIASAPQAVNTALLVYK